MELSVLQSQGQDGVTPGQGAAQHSPGKGLQRWPEWPWQGQGTAAASLPSLAAAHSLFTWGEGINKRVITAIYIKLDILKALCKH